MEMTIEVFSGIRAEGFTVTIYDNQYEFVKKDFIYGYTVSHNKYLSENYPNKPYAGDVLKKYIEKYDLKIDDVGVVAGKNIYTNEKISYTEAERFMDKYLFPIWKEKE